MKIKSAIITAAAAFTAFTMSVSAAPKTTEVATSTVTAADAVTTTAATTTHTPTAGSVIIDSDMVESGEFFDEVMEYVGKDNTANLSNNLEKNALAINSSVIDYSDKSMYTITTRSGDVFYLIINSDDGSCLFLNSVDTADLTSLLSRGSSTDTMNRDALNNIEVIESEQPETIPLDETAAEESVTTKTYLDNSCFDSFIWILVAVIGCIAVAAIVFVIKSRRRKSDLSSYNEAFEEDIDSDKEE